MVLLALAPLLLLGTALSDAESLALTFVKRLEAAQLLDGVLPEAPTLTSNELRPNVVSVRVAERYSVAVDLPVRQVYGFTDLDLARSETGTIPEGWDEEAYGRRVRLVHAATGAARRGVASHTTAGSGRCVINERARKRPHRIRRPIDRRRPLLRVRP